MPTKSRGLDSIRIISGFQQGDHGQFQLAHWKRPNEGMFAKIWAEKYISQSHSLSSLQFPAGAPHLKFGGTSKDVALGVRKKFKNWPKSKSCRDSNLQIAQYLKRLL